MKAKLKILMGAVAMSALAFSIQAAERTNTNRYATREYDGRAMKGEHLGQVVKASDVIGKEVKNLQDDKLGKIDDLAVDIETGRILEVFVSSGGVLGIGDKVVAVPPAAFSCEMPHPTLRLDVTKEKLKSAPAFEMSKWNENTDTNRLSEGYRYFGKEPYFARIHRTDDYKRADDKSWTVPVRIERASKIIGASVRNEGDEKLGKVDNLMVDVEAGRIVHIILSSGGFLGVGDELRALPSTAFHYREADNALIVNASKDTVINSPRFKTTEWPNFSDSAYSAGVYRAYRVEPYFGTDADNTRRNVRDRDDRNLTPLDQGASESDVDTTRRIRKEILNQQNLSVNARNVKVITLNGRVTLRGPVNTTGEKQSIEEMVQRLAPGASVDNQLEVKQPDNR